MDLLAIPDSHEAAFSQAQIWMSDEFQRIGFLIAEQVQGRINLSSMTSEEERYRLAMQKLNLLLEIFDEMEVAGVMIRNDDYREAAEKLFNRHMRDWLNLNKR